MRTEEEIKSHLDVFDLAFEKKLTHEHPAWPRLLEVMAQDKGQAAISGLRWGLRWVLGMEALEVLGGILRDLGVPQT